MPLPPPTVQRKLLHTRTIVCRGYQREDGDWEMEGAITDVKNYVANAGERKNIPAGEPVHSMAMRLTLDTALTIKAATAVTDYAPNILCPNILPNFQRLVGLSLTKGFRKAVKEQVGGTQGCVHLVDLLGPMATTTYQTANFDRNQKLRAAAKTGNATRPPFLDTCHTWASGSEVVKREFPALYTGT
jgi:hypothetical protein